MANVAHIDTNTTTTTWDRPDPVNAKQLSRLYRRYIRAWKQARQLLSRPLPPGDGDLVSRLSNIVALSNKIDDIYDEIDRLENP